MEMDWRDAWDQDKHEVGRAVHEGWAAEKVRQGFADHVWVEDLGQDGAGNWGGPVPGCGAWLPGGYRCALPRDRHHADMLDFDDLPPHIQEYDMVTGIIGYRMGFERARRSARPAGEGA